MFGHGCNLNGVRAFLHGRDGLSAGGATAGRIVIIVTVAGNHGIFDFRGQGCIGEIAVAEFTFPMLHIAFGAGGRLGRVVDADAVAEGDASFSFGLRVGETSATNSALAVDDDGALGIDRVDGAELRIGVRAHLLSPGSLGCGGLEEIGHHAASEMCGVVAHGFSGDVAVFRLVHISDGSCFQLCCEAFQDGVTAEHHTL